MKQSIEFWGDAWKSSDGKTDSSRYMVPDLCSSRGESMMTVIILAKLCRKLCFFFLAHGVHLHLRDVWHQVVSTATLHSGACQKNKKKEIKNGIWGIGVVARGW